MNIEKFGEATRTEIARQVNLLLSVHAEALNVAYIKHGDASFSVSIKVDVIPAGANNGIQTAISYQPEPKVRDVETGTASEDQMSLFDDPGVECKVYE